MGPSKIDADDVCPVCKSSRYLNPNMKFMIEPSCYHKMCESCVDRIFSSGPAPCPVAGCGKTLRKARFKYPNFEDLAIEKEVDIRARVARVLNLRESDFETLRDFNDYEEKKEDFIWNLVKGIDTKQTEEELAAHANQYNKEIAKNHALEEEEAAKLQDDEAERLEKSALAREAALKEVKDEKADRAAGKKAVVDRLASSKLGDVSAAAYTEPTATRKQSSLRRSAPAREAAATSTKSSVTWQRQGAATATTGAASSLGFRGMKKEATPPAPEAPYDPFGGMEIVTKYYTLQDAYDHQWSDRAKTDPIFTAGGYDVREYYARAQVDAHAGLGVFVGEEMRKRETASVH